MKYLIKHDLKNIICKRKYWLFFYFFVLIVFAMLFKNYNQSIADIFLVNIGLKYEKGSFLKILIYIFNLFFFIFLCVDVMLGNLKSGVYNIFLRMKRIKICLSKFLSNLIVIILVSIISFVLLYIVYLSSGIKIQKIFIFLIIEVIFRLIICMYVSLILTALFYDRKVFVFIIFFVAILICIQLNNFVQPYLFKDRIIYLLFNLVISIITYFIVFKRSMIGLFERSF